MQSRRRPAVRVGFELATRTASSSSFMFFPESQVTPQGRHRQGSNWSRDQRLPVLCHCQLGQDIPYTSRVKTQAKTEPGLLGPLGLVWLHKRPPTMNPLRLWQSEHRMLILSRCCNASEPPGQCNVRGSNGWEEIRSEVEGNYSKWSRAIIGGGEQSKVEESRESSNRMCRARQGSNQRWSSASQLIQPAVVVLFLTNLKHSLYFCYCRNNNGKIKQNLTLHAQFLTRKKNR